MGKTRWRLFAKNERCGTRRCTANNARKKKTAALRRGNSPAPARVVLAPTQQAKPAPYLYYTFFSRDMQEVLSAQRGTVYVITLCDAPRRFLFSEIERSYYYERNHFYDCFRCAGLSEHQPGRRLRADPSKGLPRIPFRRMYPHPPHPLPQLGRGAHPHPCGSVRG